MVMFYDIIYYILLFIPYYAILRCIMFHYTKLHYTVLYDTILRYYSISYYIKFYHIFML